MQKATIENFTILILMHILTKMAPIGGLDKIFDRNIKRWEQSFIFIDAFDQRALTSSQYFHIVAKFIKWKVEDHTQVIEPNAQQISSLFFFPNSSSIPSAEDKDRKHEYENLVELYRPQDFAKIHRNRRKQNIWSPSSNISISIPTSPPSSDQESAIMNPVKSDLEC